MQAEWIKLDLGLSNKAAMRSNVGTEILAPFCFQKIVNAIKFLKFLASLSLLVGSKTHAYLQHPV